jgi:hypothetical protein
MKYAARSYTEKEILFSGVHYDLECDTAWIGTFMKASLAFLLLCNYFVYDGSFTCDQSAILSNMLPQFQYRFILKFSKNIIECSKYLLINTFIPWHIHH